MVRECRPPAREPTRSWLARRSTTATSTRANANSPANISPVGPPPTITTACSVIATLRSRQGPTRPHVARMSTTAHAFRDPGFWLQPVALPDEPGLAASPLGAPYERGGFNAIDLSMAYKLTKD